MPLATYEVAYFTLWGMLDNTGRLVYRADDSWPDDPGNDYSSVERIEQNWFLTRE